MFLLNQHFRLFKRFFYLLLPYSLLRIGFYFYHLSIYKQYSQDQIFESFLLGIRFDLAAICLLNSPIVLLNLLPLKGKLAERVERILFVLLNFVGITASLNDFELFLFLGKRLSFDFFAITGDILQQLPQVTLYYWYLPLISVLMGIGFYYIDKKLCPLKREKKTWPRFLASSFFLLGLSFVAIRGGLQHKSINVQSAFTQGANDLGHLVVNTPYHFLRTLKNKSIEKLSFFPSDEAAINVILNRRDLRFNESGKKKNVVLIILESFSLEYMEEGYTPFLSELQKKSLFYPKHLANGRRSIEALPSLLCGLPSLLDEPISKSIFQSNKFVCMPELLKEAGYTNYFFHGGAKGTMGFHAYTLSHGFDRYFSREDYPKSEDFDGTWGIFDGPYLEYFADELKQMPKPFFGTVFTLSSHHPYAVPENLKNKFPKGSLEIHESIGYTDHALREFFKKIENEEWAKETIFFITSDHSQKLNGKKFQNMVGQFRVPFLVFEFGKEGSLEQKVTQHSDIPKSILDAVGIKGERMPLTSVSVFSQDAGYALNYAYGQDYLLVAPEGVYSLNRSSELVFMNYDWDSGDLSTPSPSEDLLLKAYLQYFFNGLITNNLSLYR